MAHETYFQNGVNAKRLQLDDSLIVTDIVNSIDVSGGPLLSEQLVTAQAILTYIQGGTENVSTVNGISGDVYLMSGDGIDITTSDVITISLDDNYITESSVASISGNLQGQITDNSLYIANLNVQTAALSANQDQIIIDVENNSNLISEIQNVTGSFLVAADLDPYALQSTLESVSGSLQNQIDNIEQESTIVLGGSGISVIESPEQTFTVSVSADYALTSYVDSVSGNIISYVDSADNNLQNQITDNSNNISILDSQVATISGDLDILESIVENLSASDIAFTSSNDYYDYSANPNPENVQEGLDGVSNLAFRAYRGTINNASTGWIAGGQISVASTTEINISAGQGIIVDHEDYQLNPDLIADSQIISWDSQTVEVPNLSGSNYTVVGIDMNGDVVWSNDQFTPEQNRDYIELGEIIHQAGVVGYVKNVKHTSVDVYSQLNDLAKAIGTMNLSGNVLQPHDADNTLEISKTAGTSFRWGFNTSSDINNPSYTTESVQDPATWVYAYRDGADGHTYVQSVTAINPNQYDNGTGTLASVPSNDYSIQRAYMFPGTGQIIILYGQATYDTYDQAVNGLYNENFEDVPDFFHDASLRAYIILKQGITNFSNANYFTFVEGGKFNGTAGSSSTGSTTSTFSDGNFAVYYDSQPDKNLSFDLSNLDAAGEEIVLSANSNQAGDIIVTLPSETGELALTSYVDSVSGNIIDYVNVADNYLQGQITDNSNLITEIQGITGDFLVSSDLDDYITEAEVASISGNLQTQIDEKVDGTGTANQIAIWSDSDTIGGTAKLTHDGNTLNINCTTDTNALNIEGTNNTVIPLFNLQHNSLATHPNNGKVFSIQAGSESYARSMFYSDGSFSIGSGSALRDVFVKRIAVNNLAVGATNASSSDGEAKLTVYGPIKIGDNGSFSEENGNIWYEADDNKFKFRQNGETVELGSDTFLIGGEGISVTESPTGTWTISVSGDYAEYSLVESVSGNLQGQIDDLSSDVISISGDLSNYLPLTGGTLTGPLNIINDNLLISRTDAETGRFDIQTNGDRNCSFGLLNSYVGWEFIVRNSSDQGHFRFWNNYLNDSAMELYKAGSVWFRGDITANGLAGNTGEIVTLDSDGTLLASGSTISDFADYSLVESVSGNLQGQITDNSNLISEIQGITGDFLVSSDLDDYITTVEVASISGNLQGQITDNSVLISELQAVSGDFSEYLPLTGGTVTGTISLNGGEISSLGNWVLGDNGFSGQSSLFGITLDGTDDNTLLSIIANQSSNISSINMRGDLTLSCGSDLEIHSGPSGDINITNYGSGELNIEIPTNISSAVSITGNVTIDGNITADNLTAPDRIEDIFAHQFLNPSNDDWGSANFDGYVAPLQPDTSGAALQVRMFDDTVSEGIGFMLQVDDDTTEIDFISTIGTRGTSGNINYVIERRLIDNTTGPGSWSILGVVETDASSYFKQSTMTKTTLTAGKLYQMLWYRDPTVFDTITGDVALQNIRIVQKKG